jgi:hypothetical protein
MTSGATGGRRPRTCAGIDWASEGARPPVVSNLTVGARTRPAADVLREGRLRVLTGDGEQSLGATGGPQSQATSSAQLSVAGSGGWASRPCHGEE